MTIKPTPAAEWREKGEPDPHAGHYDGPREKLTLGHMSDDALANGAFMNYDQPLNIAKVLAGDKDYFSPIAWMTGVKDRIRWLSRTLVKAESERDTLSTKVEHLKFLNTEANIALAAYEKAFEALFAQCCSNGVFDAWQKPVDCTLLNEAHDLASRVGEYCEDVIL
jgi:hypothetical protein